jgi:hypothetical protein
MKLVRSLLMAVALGGLCFGAVSCGKNACEQLADKICAAGGDAKECDEAKSKAKGASSDEVKKCEAALPMIDALLEMKKSMEKAGGDVKPPEAK